MNLHPNVTGTVGNWSLANTLADSSGNGLTLAALDGNTQHTPGGTVQYASLGTLTGFKFDGNTKLWAPLSALLQITGDMTIQWIMYQVGTASQTYFCCCDPAGRSGGASPDRTGSMFSWFWGSPNNPYYRNQNTGGGGGSGGATYGRFTAQTQVWGVAAVHHYTFRRQVAAGGASATMSAFVDGVIVATDTTVWDGLDWLPNTSTGIERFFVGGYEGASVNLSTNSIMGGLVVTAAAIPPATIGQRAFTALGPATTSDTGIVYDAVAASQFAESLRLAPKSNPVKQ